MAPPSLLLLLFLGLAPRGPLRTYALSLLLLCCRRCRCCVAAAPAFCCCRQLLLMLLLLSSLGFAPRCPCAHVYAPLRPIGRNTL